MIIQLITGRSLYMSVNQYLDMSDNELKDAVAWEQGCFFNHPFIDTALVDNCKDNPDEEEEEVWINEDPEDNELFSIEDISELMQSEGTAD
jgi:hypothetical protein